MKRPTWTISIDRIAEKLLARIRGKPYVRKMPKTDAERARLQRAEQTRKRKADRRAGAA